jgi:hypothetical protein
MLDTNIDYTQELEAFNAESGGVYPVIKLYQIKSNSGEFGSFGSYN